MTINYSDSLPCSKCGNKNIQFYDVYCSQCGANVRKQTDEKEFPAELLKCNECGTLILPNHNFCAGCGITTEEALSVEIVATKTPPDHNYYFMAQRAGISGIERL